MNYQALVQAYLGDGARSSKFDLTMELPGFLKKFSNLKDKDYTTALSILCKSSSFPGKTVSTQDIVFRGQTIRIPMQSNFSGDWTCDFYSDETHGLRKLFENWSNAVNASKKGADFLNLQNNSNLVEDLIPENFILDDVKIFQFPFEAQIGANPVDPDVTYTLYGVFPTNIAQVEATSESDSIETFQVTFNYTYFEIS